MKKYLLFCSIFVYLVIFSVSCAKKPDEQKARKQAIAFRDLGQAYMAEGKDTSAFAQFKKAEALYPDDPHVHFNLGVFYYKKEKYDLSILEYNKALELKSDFASAKNNLGIVYLAKKDWDTAIECFNDLLDNYIYATPHFPLFLLGQAYFHKKEYKTAVKYFKESIKMEPNFMYAQLWKGKSYIAMGKMHLAESTLQKAVKQAPGFAELYLELGKVYESTRRPTSAFNAYLQVIALVPESELAEEAEKRLEKIKKTKKAKKNKKG